MRAVERLHRARKCTGNDAAATATATAAAGARDGASRCPPASRCAQRAPLRVVAPEGRRRAGGRRITESSPRIVVAALLAWCAPRHAGGGQVRLSSIQTQLNAEQAVHRQEVAAVASLETPSRIVSQSEQQLHMGTPPRSTSCPLCRSRHLCLLPSSRRRRCRHPGHTSPPPQRRRPPRARGAG